MVMITSNYKYVLCQKYMLPAVLKFDKSLCDEIINFSCTIREYTEVVCKEKNCDGIPCIMLNITHSNT